MNNYKVKTQNNKQSPDKLFDLLTLFLGGLIFYIPLQIHFPQSLGIPGLNVLNLLFAIACLIYIAKKQTNSTPAPLRGRIFFLYLMMLFGFIVAQIRSPYSLMSDLTYLKTALFTPLLYFLYYFAVRDLKRIRLLLLAIMAVAGIAALEGLKEGLAYGSVTFSDTKRAAGPFGYDFRDSNRAGVFYAMFVPVFAAGFMFYKNIRWIKIASMTGFIITLAALFFTFSRQAYIIALFAIMFLTFKRGLIAPIIALVFLINYQLWVPDAAIDRISGTTQQTSTTGTEEVDESTMSRFELWKGAVRMWADYPLGIGLNRFQSEIGNYSIYSGKDAHNHYVLFATEASLLGLFAHCLLLLGILQVGRKLSKIAVTSEAKAIGYGFTCCAICMMLGNIFGSPFFNNAVMGNFWIMTALVTRYFEIVSEDGSQIQPQSRFKSYAKKTGLS